MRLQTEAFDHNPFSIGIILIGLVVVIIAGVIYTYIENTSKRGKKPAAAVYGVVSGVYILMCMINITVNGVNTVQLNEDLKRQLGIEKVSYDDDYRELTGEKDGTVVFCVLAEEGEKGNIYEVICK